MAPPPFVELMLANARSGVANLHVRSALNPILWLCGIVSLPCFVMAFAFRSFPLLAHVLIVIGALPVLAAIGAFIYFALFKPENLRSEDFNIRHEALELIRSKGSDVELAPTSLDAITNPAVKPLPGGAP